MTVIACVWGGEEMLHIVTLHWGLIHRTSMLRVAALCQGMPQGGGGGKQSQEDLIYHQEAETAQKLLQWA